jgi:hypothetical protein
MLGCNKLVCLPGSISQNFNALLSDMLKKKDGTTIANEHSEQLGLTVTLGPVLLISSFIYEWLQ